MSDSILIDWLRETEVKLRERATQQQRTAASCFDRVATCRPRGWRVYVEQSVRGSSAEFARQYADDWARAHAALREAEALLYERDALVEIGLGLR